MTYGALFEQVARATRTSIALRPIQAVARPWALATRRFCTLIPSAGAPEVRRSWAAPVPALERFVQSEADRATSRLSRIPARTLLARYEQTYGLDILERCRAGVPTWSDPVALHPFPASIRARQLSLAIRLGRTPPEKALAQASRAILAQPELHLLGNHLLENGFGLACAGAAAMGPEAELWWRIGRAIICHELTEQFLPDGGHFERSASYHSWLTAALLETLELATASGRLAPPSWFEVATRALGWLSAVRGPDGTPPLFNDATLDAAPSIDAVQALGRAMGLGPAAVATEDCCAGARISTLPHTGWLVLAAGDRAWLVVDAGPDGAPYQPGHVHADALTFELWLDGERVCVDYGVSSYLDDEARRLTRATRSHNTVEVDGRDSSEVWSAFRVGRRASGRVVAVAHAGGEITATVEHDGYRWLPGKPVHRRTITLAPGELRIEDRLSAAHRVRSTVRCDEKAMRTSGMKVTGSGGREISGEGAWYPQFAEPRAARVTEILAALHPGAETRWNLRW